MSEINFIMLDLKNLYVATKIMCLAQILKKTFRILSFGGHLGRHLEYFNFPNDAKMASFSFNLRTYWRIHLCKNILCGLFFWVAPKIFIWQPDYMRDIWKIPGTFAFSKKKKRKKKSIFFFKFFLFLFKELSTYVCIRLTSSMEFFLFTPQTMK